MLCCRWFPPTGVEASAAQNAPVTKTCSQCGAVLPRQLRACSFCEAPLIENDANGASADAAHTRPANRETAWRSELAHRVESYRSRRGKQGSDAAQSHLPFADEPSVGSRVALEEAPSQARSAGGDEFAFTIAIGRPGKPIEEPQLLIDISASPDPQNPGEQAAAAPEPASASGLYPVADMEERRLAAFIDTACLLFACGGFLALFGSLGGQFAFSKLNAVVYSVAFAIVYVQYFSLFTVFGGTTPGMMLRGLQVVDFSGEQPSSRQLLIRAAGYLLSAGTFFLGFLWATWDEDSLTWHDRVSHTYLSSAETFTEAEIGNAAASR